MRTRLGSGAPLRSAIDAYAIPCTNALLARVLPFYVDLRWKSRPARRHELPGRLIVSLTSYPPRFRTLPLTLKCLLSQSVAADRVILWIAREDRRYLTREILEFLEDGLTIAFCENWGPYNKIIPALLEYPDTYLVTADDDAYYGPAWLEQLVADRHAQRQVVCHRAHRIRTSRDGVPLPYRSWEMATGCGKPSPLIFPTGCAGVLYPPGALHRDVTNVALFRRICADADDVWLYWMMRRNGGAARKIGSRRVLLPNWHGTQSVALWQLNVVGGGNDKCIKAMTARFGFPRA